MPERPDPLEESQQPVTRPEPSWDQPESTGISAVDSLYDALSPSADQIALGRRPPIPRQRPRRVKLPIILFAVTCLSTFFAGATDWQPLLALDGPVGWRQLVLRNWQQGIIYMGCVLAILLTHEMGHFVATLFYRVPASLPFFIPFPITPIGTMGAVIGMEGHRANRRGIFDIGLAGPLAGLAAAAPILWLGITRLDLDDPVYGSELYDLPLLMEWMITWLRPEHAGLSEVRSSQLNAYFMAGWVGLLITGLNMLPVSQLDGGHVIYALFGRRAHWIARGFILLSITYIVLAEEIIWAPMVILVILIGTDHPPTANDRISLGWYRYALGYASLLIPVLCFPLHGMIPVLY
jgi:Zn-dependent protease